MSVSRSAPADPADGAPRRGALLPRQRLALIADAALDPQEALAMDDGAFDFAFLQTHGIGAKHVRAARLNPMQLRSRGVTNARDLRALDFNSLDLTDPSWCASAIAAFGAADVTNEFILTPNDAVAISGTCAVHQLGLDVATLLLLCAGARREAESVLALAQPRSQCLRGVPPATLIDAGVGAAALRDLGFGANEVATLTRATVVQLEALGF